MKGYHFFAEMPEARRSKSASKAHPFAPWTRKYLSEVADRGGRVNCLAVDSDRGNAKVISGDLQRDAIAPVRDTSNAPVTGTGVSQEYLRTRCTRIPEELARRLHPALFAMLDYEPPAPAEGGAA